MPTDLTLRCTGCSTHHAAGRMNIVIRDRHAAVLCGPCVARIFTDKESADDRNR